MIKQIRKRFTIIALIALSLAMLLVAGVINVVHIINTVNELDDTLDYLAENESIFAQKKQEKAALQSRDESEEIDEEFFSDRFMQQKGHNHGMKTRLEESRYFIAIQNEDNELFLGAGSKESDCTEEELLSIAGSVFDSDDDSGFHEDYLYKVSDNSDGSHTAVFLNCESKKSEIISLMFISLGACITGILLAWLMVALLSKRAIKPMMDNIERQKQFITDAGHELKTPLTVISANMDVLSLDTGSNEWIISTQKQVSNMRKLVNELVYLSRMDEANWQLESSEFNFSDTVQDVSLPFVGMAEFNGKDLTVDVEDNIRFCGDEKAIRRLISVLCENAVKHAPEDSNIKISLHRSGKNIVFETENEMKEPLDKEALSRLFDRFYRGDSSRSKEENSGFGIGLSIARAITEKHSGTIKAKTTEYGRLQIICIF